MPNYEPYITGNKSEHTWEGWGMTA